MVIIFYTILIQSKPKTKTFNIKFSTSNAPKDIWDHRDAVEDYLIDFWPNPFEQIPEFEIVSYNTTNNGEQQ